MSAIKTKKTTSKWNTSDVALQRLSHAIAADQVEIARLYALIDGQREVIQTLMVQLSMPPSPSKTSTPVNLKKVSRGNLVGRSMSITYLKHRIGRPTKEEASARIAAGIFSKKKKKQNLSGRRPGRPRKSGATSVATKANTDRANQTAVTGKVHPARRIAQPSTPHDGKNK